MKGISTRFVSLIALLVCNLCYCASAQITWKKLYYDYNDVYPFAGDISTDIKYDSINSKYIFMELSHSNAGVPSVWEIDTNGNLLYRNYYSATGGGGQNFKFTKDGGIIISDAEPITSTLFYKTLYKLDSSYTILWKYRYGFPIGLGDCGLKETTDHDFIVATDAYYPSSWIDEYPCLLKTDSVGNVLLFKLYRSFAGLPKSVLQTTDGNYLIGFNSYRDMGTMLLKTDTSGNVLWSKSYLRPHGYMNDMLEKPNGHIIIIGSTDSTYQTPISVMFMTELDSAGNTLWCKTFGDSNNMLGYDISFAYPIPTIIKPTFDNGYIITSEIQVSTRPATDLILLKTDSIGNIQWERRHGGYESAEEGIDLIQTPDKGFCVLGNFAIDLNTEGYYVLKTDSLGFAGCEEFSDSIAQNSINPTDSSIVIADSLIVISMTPASVSSDTFSAPDVDDGCLLDGLKETVLNENGLLIYPNPTSGKFHLTVSDAAFKEKDVFIYDVLGNEVYINTKTTLSDFDIDLSKNAKGVYFVKVVGEGILSVSRVVVI